MAAACRSANTPIDRWGNRAISAGCLPFGPPFGPQNGTKIHPNVVLLAVRRPKMPPKCPRKPPRGHPEAGFRQFLISPERARQFPPAGKSRFFAKMRINAPPTPPTASESFTPGDLRSKAHQPPGGGRWTRRAPRLPLRNAQALGPPTGRGPERRKIRREILDFDESEHCRGTFSPLT